MRKSSDIGVFLLDPIRTPICTLKPPYFFCIRSTFPHIYQSVYRIEVTAMTLLSGVTAIGTDTRSFLGDANRDRVDVTSSGF